MLFDLFTSIFQAIIIVAVVFGFIYIFAKKPMVFVCTLAVIIILGGLIVAPSIAESPFIEAQGYITRVAPEFFNGYPVLVITVETFDGEVYTYFSEEEIDTQGIITLLLFGEEVIDVY